MKSRPESCVKTEKNDDIYFRIYTEELFLGFSENYALCTKSIHERKNMALCCYKPLFITVLQESAGEFLSYFIKEMPIKGMLC